MIYVKHLLDAVESSDGQRMWVEPIGLTRDLREWCRVDHVLCHLGPPKAVWQVLESHPDAYDFFRARYHEFLAKSQYKPALQKIPSTTAPPRCAISSMSWRPTARRMNGNEVSERGGVGVSE